MARGTLYGVSVGPGDPELLTLKAVRVIEAADVIAVPDTGDGPGTAAGIARRHTAGKRLLRCPTPMTRDRAALERAHREAADQLCALLEEGLLVAYLCLGDVGVYSSYYHLHALVRERGYETQVVAGVTSFCAAAARLGVPLCQGSEQLLVSPATAALPHAAPGEQMNAALMKLGSSVADLREELARRDGPCEAKVVASCGLPGERVYDSLEDAPDDLGYLSLALVRPLLQTSPPPRQARPS